MCVCVCRSEDWLKLFHRLKNLVKLKKPQCLMDIFFVVFSPLPPPHYFFLYLSNMIQVHALFTELQFSALGDRLRQMIHDRAQGRIQEFFKVGDSNINFLFSKGGVHPQDTLFLPF